MILYPQANDVVMCIYKNGKLQAKEVIRRLCGQEGDEQYDHSREWSVAPPRPPESSSLLTDLLYTGAERYEDVMRDLLLHYYLQPSSPISHTSANDRRLAYEQEEMTRVRRMLKPKERIEMHARARERVREDEEGVWKYTNAELAEMSGKATERKGVLKRQKRKAVTTNGNGKATKKRRKDEGSRKKTSSRSKKSSKLALSDSEDDEAGAHAASDDSQELCIDVRMSRSILLSCIY